MTRLAESWASSDAVRASMRSNRSRDTKPELELRRAVFALGLRYRVAFRPLPELRRSADLAFTKTRVAVLVDGCFWHGCPKHYTSPKKNADFWAAKIAANRVRDVETDKFLAAAGWVCIRVWEHEDLKTAATRIAAIVEGRRSQLAA